MNDMQTRTDTPFSRRSVFWLISIGIVATLGIGITSVFVGDINVGGSVGADSYSRSAIGHRALYRYLEKSGYQVQQSQAGTSDKLWQLDTVLFLLEPQKNETVKTHIDGALNISPTLFVLPKRAGIRDQANPQWINRDRLFGVDYVRDVAKYILPSVDVIRPKQSGGDWTAAVDMAYPPEIENLQLLQSDDIEPLIQTSDGILLGRLKTLDESDESDGDGDSEWDDQSDWPIWVLSDPDLIANHGIGDGWNLELVTQLVETLADGNQTIIFDEVIHGFAVEPSLAKAMFARPFIYPTLASIVAFLVFFAATTRRFGAPVSARASLSDSKAVFLANTARLIRVAEREAFAAEALLKQAGLDVAGKLNVAASIGQRDLAAWLDSKGLSLGIKETYSGLENAIKKRTNNRTDLMEITDRIQKWRQAMLQKGSGV